MSSLCHYSFIHDLSIHNFVCHFTAPCIYFSPSTHETFFIDNETYRLPSYHLLFLVHKSFHIRKHSDCFSTEKIYIYSILLRRNFFFCDMNLFMSFFVQKQYAVIFETTAAFLFKRQVAFLMYKYSFLRVLFFKLICLLFL